METNDITDIDRINSRLVHACKYGLLGTVKYLVQCGADINWLHSRALYVSLCNMHYDVAEYLKSCGSNNPIINIHIGDDYLNDDYIRNLCGFESNMTTSVSDVSDVNDVSIVFYSSESSLYTPTNVCDRWTIS